MNQENYTPSVNVNQVKIEFTDKPITAWGGIATLIAKFLEVIQFRSWVDQIIPVDEISPNGGGIYEKVLGHLLTVLCGGYRFSHSMWWHHGQAVLCRCFGVAWLPKSVSTMTRFWGKFFLQSHADQMGHQGRHFARALIGHEGIREDTLNLDSTVVTRYGHQEGAKKGYNPKKPGRPSHHPLLAFIGSGYVVNLWNRSGDSHSSHRSIEFFDQAIDTLGANFGVTRVNADSGFYDVDFMDHLEQSGLTYTVAVRGMPIIQDQVFRVSTWDHIGVGLALGEFWFKHVDRKWSLPRRYVVVRQDVTAREKTTGKQLSMFEEMDIWQNYRFSIFVTNDYRSTPREVWDGYRPRANDENVIKDLKEGYGFASFNMESFWATESVMIFNALVAHNLIHYLNRQVISVAKPRPQLRTLRLKYFILPAMLGRDAGTSVLRISVQATKMRQMLVDMVTKIDRISLRVNCIAV